MRYLLVGNYGVGNLGDEALKEYFLRNFPEIEWLVLSANPEPGELPRFPAGVRSFFTTAWWKTIFALLRSDGLVFGGGTLFTDIESAAACRIWWLHALWARVFRKPIFLTFQGIGPFKKRGPERLACSVIRSSVFISVRDDASFHRIESWIQNTKIVQTFDPVFALIDNKKEVNRSKKLISAIPRKNSNANFIKTLKNCMANDNFSELRIVSLDPDNVDERVVIRNLMTEFPRASIKEVRTLYELTNALEDADFILTERYHGGIAALRLGIPFECVAQGSNDKLSALQTLGKEITSEELEQRVLFGEAELRKALSR